VTVDFEKKAGRQIKARDLTEFHDGTGLDYLLLNQWPVVSVSMIRSLNYDGTVYHTYDVGAADIHVGPTGKLILRAGQNWFARGYSNTEVTYKPGWATIPDDVKGAALEWVADRFRNWQNRRDPIKSVTTAGGQSTTYFDDAIPKRVRLVLDEYTLIGASA
jgi:hypothetical protein